MSCPLPEETPRYHVSGAPRLSVEGGAMRREYVPQERACMDGVHLRPVPPGKTRRELFCPSCQAAHCPFGHRRQPAKELPAERGAWLTVRQAAKLVGVDPEDVYQAISLVELRSKRASNRAYLVLRTEVEALYLSDREHDDEEEEPCAFS